MRNPNRIENFLRVLGEEWRRQGPDLRFTQFLFNNGIDNLNGILYQFEEHELLHRFFPQIPAREYLYWGSYGKDCKGELSYRLIKDLETDHIKNILLNVKHIDKLYNTVFEDELKLRENVD